MKLEQRDKLQEEVMRLQEEYETLEILQEEFKDNDLLNVILEKKQDLCKKKEKLQEEVQLFDRLYENYIFKIVKLLNEEKKLVVKNRKFLEMHPDIMKSIMNNIVEKEGKFRNIMKQL